MTFPIDDPSLAVAGADADDARRSNHYNDHSSLTSHGPGEFMVDAAEKTYPGRGIRQIGGGSLDGGPYCRHNGISRCCSAHDAVRSIGDYYNERVATPEDLHSILVVLAARGGEDGKLDGPDHLGVNRRRVPGLPKPDNRREAWAPQIIGKFAHPEVEATPVKIKGWGAPRVWPGASPSPGRSCAMHRPI